jgi:hypothetical protein
MVGLWGLIEHSCESPPLNFSVVEHSGGDDVVWKSNGGGGSNGVAGVHLELGSCTTAVCKRGFYVWNYGQDFLVGMKCKCFSCLT